MAGRGGQAEPGRRALSPAVLRRVGSTTSGAPRAAGRVSAVLADRNELGDRSFFLTAVVGAAQRAAARPRLRGAEQRAVGRAASGRRPPPRRACKAVMSIAQTVLALVPAVLAVAAVVVAAVLEPQRLRRRKSPR